MKVTVDKALLNQVLMLANAIDRPNSRGSWNPTGKQLNALRDELRAALAQPAVEPVGYASIEGLRQLQYCNGMSVWCESPSMWGPKEQAPPPPENLVAIYTAPRPMHFQEPVAWAHDRFIENADGMRIGTDEPELQWGKYVPDDDGGWFPLYASPPPPAEVPLLSDEEIDACDEAARISFKQYKSKVRGQQIMPPDGFEWHFARAIEAAYRRKLGLK